MRMTIRRWHRLKEVVENRQLDLTVVLENVHDPHNIGAVLRSCDAVGISEIFVLYTEPQLTPSRVKLGKRTSAGARKWIKVHHYRDPVKCMAHVRRKYRRILCAMPSPDARRLWDLDLTGPTALVMGNERDGVSDAVRSLSDGDFVIPMAGMVQSLNISVACAVTLYEVFRQREVKGMYPAADSQADPLRKELLDHYVARHHGEPNG
jgi:tRNA (guanosine-2'-O-)-methyltransferase